MEIEGKVFRLSGSLDSQYNEWRSILRSIFALETGSHFDGKPNCDTHESSNQYGHTGHGRPYNSGVPTDRDALSHGDAGAAHSHADVHGDGDGFPYANGNS